MRADALRPRVGSLRQYASVRRIVLDDGAERGVRALAFSTGGGLDFWVMADRSLDLGLVSWRGVSLAWQAPHGFRSPFLHVAEEDGGHGFDRSFSGFLATAGLDHIRRPDAGQPLHGRLAMTPADVTAYGEDWDGDPPTLFCEGTVRQSRVGGASLRLVRRIEAPIGGAEIVIRDRIRNEGGAAVEQALLYHLNLGAPGIDEGTTVEFRGAPLGEPLAFGAADTDVLCVAAGPPEDGPAVCTVRTPLGSGERRITISFDPATLPYLQIYRDLRAASGLLAIEPCTSQRLEGGRSGPGPILRPGESRTTVVRIGIEETASGPD